MPGAEQTITLGDFNKFVSRARTIAFLFRLLDKKIIHMLFHPGLAGLGAFHRVKMIFSEKSHANTYTSNARRRDLRALSQRIKPVVWIGAAGLSESVIHELDRALKSHELIKIKVSADERETREAMLEEICQRLSAAPVRHIGRILVIYRPDVDDQRIKEEDMKSKNSSRKSSSRKK